MAFDPEVGAMRDARPGAWGRGEVHGGAGQAPHAGQVGWVEFDLICLKVLMSGKMGNRQIAEE